MKMSNPDLDAPDQLPGTAGNTQEKKWVTEVPRGNIDAFQEMYREYYPQLCQFLLRFVKSPVIAEDLVQDVFLNIWKNRLNWKPHGSLRAYLFVSAKNQALNHIKKWKVRNFSELKEEIVEQTLVEEPEELLMRTELERAVIATVKKLPERRRTIYLMHREDGLTYREIADMLDISVKTVETQMSRSLKFLRERLAHLVAAPNEK